METKNLFFNIFIFLALVKLSVLDDKKYDFIIMGVDSYKKNANNIITFRGLLKNLRKKDIPDKFVAIATITYHDNNILNTTEGNANCASDKNNKQNDEYIYYNCDINTEGIKDISKINFASISFDGANVGFNDLINSNLNLLDWAKELYILNITEIEKKNDHFILKGNMHKEFNETSEFEINNDDMNANLIYQKKGEYKLVPNSSIKNKTIENRIAESSKSKIFIIASSLDNKFIEFYSRKANATIISFGNYKPPKSSEDAKGKIYLKCNDYSESLMKQYIKFNVDIYYNKTRLRMLKERYNDTIEVFGIKTSGKISNGIVSYDLTYLNTSNKIIGKISSPRDILFSNEENFSKSDNEMDIHFSDSENYEFFNKKEKKYELMDLQPDEEGNYNATNLYSSFCFKFKPKVNLTIENITKINVSYIPDNDTRFSDECYIQKNESTIYNITCSPKRQVFAPMKTLIINISNITSEGNPKTTETFLLPSEGEDSYINYENPRIYFKKKKDNGLSAGAIVAIIIASIVVISAVVFIIIKCNRPAKPLIKNSDFVNIPNSSTTINKY